MLVALKKTKTFNWKTTVLLRRPHNKLSLATTRLVLSRLRKSDLVKVLKLSKSILSKTFSPSRLFTNVELQTPGATPLHMLRLRPYLLNNSLPLVGSLIRPSAADLYIPRSPRVISFLSSDDEKSKLFKRQPRKSRRPSRKARTALRVFMRASLRAGSFGKLNSASNKLRPSLLTSHPHPSRLRVSALTARMPRTSKLSAWGPRKPYLFLNSVRFVRKDDASVFSRKVLFRPLVRRRYRRRSRRSKRLMARRRQGKPFPPIARPRPVTPVTRAPRALTLLNFPTTSQISLAPTPLHPVRIAASTKRLPRVSPSRRPDLNGPRIAKRFRKRGEKRVSRKFVIYKNWAKRLIDLRPSQVASSRHLHGLKNLTLVGRVTPFELDNCPELVSELLSDMLDQVDPFQEERHKPMKWLAVSKSQKHTFRQSRKPAIGFIYPTLSNPLRFCTVRSVRLRKYLLRNLRTSPALAKRRQRPHINFSNRTRVTEDYTTLVDAPWYAILPTPKYYKATQFFDHTPTSSELKELSYAPRLRAKRRMLPESQLLLPKYPRHNVSTSSSRKFTLKPRVVAGFVLGATTLFVSNRLFMSKFPRLSFKYLFKKKLFSFLFPNQVKKAIMNKKRRIVIHRYVSSFRRKLKKRPHFSHHYFRQNLKKFMSTSTRLASREFGSIETGDIFSSPKPSSSLVDSYRLSRGEIVDKDSLFNRGPDYTFKRKEIRIPRVRFKPGYQRIWRRARAALQENLGLKLCYQQRMTRHLAKFTRQTTFYSFGVSEMSVGRMFVYSRLLPDMNTVDSFCEAKSLYLNGRSTALLQLTAVPNDLIQLIVSVQYYIVHRWLSNWTLKRNKRFRRLVYRKGLASRHKLMKTRKQPSQHTPSWIHSARFDISDTKHFLEVDFFTLSAFVLYEPYFFNHYTPDDAIDLRTTTYRLYNWKYIN